MKHSSNSFARRNFIRSGGLMIAGGAIGGAIAAEKALAVGSDAKLRIALIGCGRRAKTLAEAAISTASEHVEVVALADRFASQTQSMYRSLKGRFAANLNPNCVRASGVDAFETVMQSDADLVYLTAPPIYRPTHFHAAVAAGKHVFLEKPIAIDADGIRSVAGDSATAKRSGLSVHVGFQRRYDECYRKVVSKIQSGAIGNVLFARAYCNVGALQWAKRAANEDQETYRIRNWNHFNSTGGDLLLEQHIAGLDAIRWVVGEDPVVVQGQGGWADATAVASSEESLTLSDCVFDHHGLEFEFPSGVRLLSQCRRGSKAWMNTSEHVHGSDGHADLTEGKVFSKQGSVVFSTEHVATQHGATLRQQAAVLETLRQRVLVNDVDEAIRTTLLTLFGHSASHSGKRLNWMRFLKHSGVADLV